MPRCPRKARVRVQHPSLADVCACVDLAPSSTITLGAVISCGTPLLLVYRLMESCSISHDKLTSFLLKLESNYGTGTNSYHNSMHGADVCLFTHLFLTKHGFDKRLSKVQLLGSLLGAIVHDFNHPGTTNAHEVKLGSSLAVS